MSDNDGKTMNGDLLDRTRKPLIDKESAKASMEHLRGFIDASNRDIADREHRKAKLALKVLAGSQGHSAEIIKAARAVLLGYLK